MIGQVYIVEMQHAESNSTQQTIEFAVEVQDVVLKIVSICFHASSC